MSRGGLEWMVAVMVLVCVATLAGGCGYTSGYRNPEGVATVAVPIFRNDTFPLRREVEFELTRALKREIETRSDLRLADPGVADGVLEGSVITFDEGVLTEGENDVILSSSIRIVARVRLVRARDGKTLFDRRIDDYEIFSTERGETVDTARAEAVAAIAHRIVADLEPW